MKNTLPTQIQVKQVKYWQDQYNQLSKVINDHIALDKTNYALEVATPRFMEGLLRTTITLTDGNTYESLHEIKGHKEIIPHIIYDDQATVGWLRTSLVNATPHRLTVRRTVLNDIGNTEKNYPKHRIAAWQDLDFPWQHIDTIYIETDPTLKAINQSNKFQTLEQAIKYGKKLATEQPPTMPSRYLFDPNTEYLLQRCYVDIKRVWE